jgi:FAD/FMN-containing dehydrogenase
MPDTAAFLAEASVLLGPAGLTRDDDLLAPWLSDWRGRYRGAALAMASPASTRELAGLVASCARHGVALVPQGGNSGMAGGATPDGSGTALLLSLRRINRIRALDTQARQVTAEAGVVLETLHGEVAKAGLRFPLTLGGKGSATVGGLTATNAGGNQVLRHGTMRAQVLGLEVVLPDGRVLDTLTPLKKDNRGFDIKQLFIGSEGTLGIVTAATLRLVPAVAARAVLWAGVPSLAGARELLLHCQAHEEQALEGFEVLPQPVLDDVLAYLPAAQPPLSAPHPWHALIELVADASGADTLPQRAEALLASAFARGLVTDATIAASEAQAEALWSLRENVAPAERAAGTAVQHDISVAVERMPAFVESASAEVTARFPGTRVAAFGHLGDGNIHLHVVAPVGTDGPGWVEGEGRAISRLVHDLVVRWAGSISAEHGIGQVKRDELARLGDPVALDLMRRVKQALDPQGLLNPGKLVPPEFPAGWPAGR